MPLTPHGALPLIMQAALTERDTLINATSFPQGAALGWVQQLGLQPATLVQPTQWNHAFRWTFVQGERRGQACLDYAEPQPKLHVNEPFTKNGKVLKILIWQSELPNWRMRLRIRSLKRTTKLIWQFRLPICKAKMKSVCCNWRFRQISCEADFLYFAQTR